MATPKSWIKAARPRTLPLAVSGIILGASLSYFDGSLHLLVSVLAILTAVLIQVFSNFANDYGDFQKGTDNENRLGPVRTMQGGEISKPEMKRGMFTVVGLSVIAGTCLVIEAFGLAKLVYVFIFIVLGIASLWAAFKYTAGKNPYGYVGLGDIFVFLFFGLIAVSGTYFLNVKELAADQFLLAISIGCFSTGVLNLNNTRDIENDRQSGKITIAVKLGKSKTLLYHYLLITIGILSPVAFTLINYRSPFQWLFLLSVPLFIRDLIQINRIQSSEKYDPYLKKLALTAFAFTLLFSLGLFIA